jgi:hypothetical protein
MLAVADARTNNNGIKRRQIERISLGQGHYLGRMPLLLYDLAQALADAWRVAVGG